MGDDHRDKFNFSHTSQIAAGILFYFAIAALFAVGQEATIKSRVDGTLAFGIPLVAVGLQTALVGDMEYGAAFSALALSFFYLLLARTQYASAGDNLRLLVESFIPDTRCPDARLDGVPLVTTGIRTARGYHSRAVPRTTRNSRYRVLITNSPFPYST